MIFHAMRELVLVLPQVVIWSYCNGYVQMVGHGMSLHALVLLILVSYPSTLLDY